MCKLLKQLSVVFVVLCLTAVSVDSQIMIDVGDTSSLVWTGKVKKQSRHNLWQGNYKSGEVAVTCTYNLGRLNGSWTKFNRDGKKYVSGNYVNGKRHGMWVQFHSTGDTHLVVHYNAGELHGPYKSYTSQRKPIMHGEYTHGRKQGVWVSYNLTQQGDEITTMVCSNDTIIKPVVTTLNNKVIRIQEGRNITAWWPTGELQMKRTVIDSQLIGYETFWETGIKKDSGAVTYEGLKVGLWTYRHKLGGVLTYEWYASKAQMRGVPHTKDADGLDSLHALWERGQVVRREVFDRSAIQRRVITSKEYNYHTETGALISVVNKQNGLPMGITTTYYPNGQIQSVINYNKLKIDGTCRWNYVDGSLLGEAQVMNNCFTSNVKFFDKKGVEIRNTTLRHSQIKDSIGRKYEILNSCNSNGQGSGDVLIDPRNPPSPENPSDVLQEVEEEALTFAHEMPYFPGGEEAMKKYIAANIIYPQEEKAAKVTGTVLVYLEVARDGTVKNVQTKKGVNGHPNFSKEAERVVKSMPKWVPGKVNGRPVTVAVTIPVNFTL